MLVIDFVSKGRGWRQAGNDFVRLLR